MSLKLEHEISKLKKELASESLRIDWIISQMKNGMTDLATITVTKILEQGLEADIVEKTTDEQLRDLNLRSMNNES
tara:strand:+ start:34 stop:261 length:228 start_codon:yes stop_codon:yes gene_type:complete